MKRRVLSFKQTDIRHAFCTITGTSKESQSNAYYLLRNYLYQTICFFIVLLTQE